MGIIDSRRKKDKKEGKTDDILSFTAKTLLPDQTFLPTKQSLHNALDAMGDTYGHIKRTLFKDSMRFQRPPITFKNDYLKRFGITARQFNAVRYDLDGNISSAVEVLKQRIDALEHRIKSVSRWLKKMNKKVSDTRKDATLARSDKAAFIKELRFQIHQKKRKYGALNTKLVALTADLAGGRIRICFGSKKLFHAQFNLFKNGYASHEEWQKDWHLARSSNVFSLGSKDENRGNQSCTLFPDKSLRIRVPNHLIKTYGKYLVLTGVSYSYGQEFIDRAHMAKSALTHRFVKKNDTWYLYTTIDVPVSAVLTEKPAEIGCIGVDVNEQEIAVAETDRFGNPVWSKTYPAPVKDKSTDVTLAVYGDLCAAIVERAIATGKPIGCEDLDFEKKKTTLKEQGVRYSRMLSSFAYTTFLTTLKRRAMRHGVAVFSVNPAYTSVIGMIKYMSRYGLTSHESAAVAIARRVQKYRESPALSGNASSLPARKRGEHVWKHLSRIKKNGVVRTPHNLYGARRSLQDFPGCAEYHKEYSSRTTAQSTRPPASTTGDGAGRDPHFANQGVWANQGGNP